MSEDAAHATCNGVRPAARALADALPSAEQEGSMKAFVYREYGGPEKLRLETVATPAPGPGEVLVEIHAASINAADYRLRRADPWLARLANGLLRPKKYPVLGSDLAGVVVATGPGVTAFERGDAVFGDAFPDGLGAFAEYATLGVEHIAGVPQGMSMREAAAVPLAGITVLQAVRDVAALEPGQKALIQGAGGGVGTLLVQMAKTYGAHVVAVCGPGSCELVRRLGADRVLDYTKSDFAAEATRYDAIFGVNGRRRLSEYKRCLVPGGIYVMIGGDNAQIFDALLKGRLVFASGGKRARILTINGKRRGDDVSELRRLLASGELKPVVDRVFPFEDLPLAFEYAERGHVQGKVVLQMRRSPPPG